MAMDHFRNNLKKERLLEDRYMEIDRENSILLKKMSEQMNKPNPYANLGRETKPASLNRDKRKQELLEITKENHRMLKSIQEVQPVYSAKRWEDNYRKSEVHLRNCSAYPVVTRMTRNASAPSVLVQLAPEGGVAATSPMASSSMEHGEGEMQEEDRRFVLKEGKRIGETYYLLEMSTDGRTLSVSAYDGETQTSLELIVKEKMHRQMYRECSGDYAQIASRLKVENNRLVITTMGPE
jgi:E3 ubiquitin-protein ligase TRIP12